MTWTGLVVRMLPIFALFCLAPSCNGFFVSESSIQSVAVSPTAVILQAAASATTPGDVYQLTSTSTTVGGTQAVDTTTATWGVTNSSSPNAFTVGNGATAGGLVTAVGTTGGETATITSTDSGTSCSSSNQCASVITYVGAVPTQLFVTSTQIASGGTVTTAGNFQLNAYLGTSTAGQNVTQYVNWSTPDTTGATVVATTGVMTVLSPGTPTTVTITATGTLGAPSGSPAPAPITGTFQFIVD